MTGIDRIHQEIKNNHASVFKNLVLIQDELSIHGAISEDIDLRLTSLTSQVENIKEGIAILDMKLSELTESNKETNQNIKALEDLIRTLIQAQI